MKRIRIKLEVQERGSATIGIDADVEMTFENGEWKITDGTYVGRGPYKDMAIISFLSSRLNFGSVVSSSKRT